MVTTLTDRLIGRWWFITAFIAVVIVCVIVFFSRREHPAPARKVVPKSEEEIAAGVARQAEYYRGREEASLRKDKELFALPRVKRSDDPAFELPFIGRVTLPIRQESVTVKDFEGRLHTLALRTFYHEKGFWVRTEYWAEGAEINPRPIKVVEQMYDFERIELANKPSPLSIVQALEKLGGPLPHGGPYPIWNATHFAITHVISREALPDAPPPRACLLVEMYGATSVNGNTGEPLLNRLRAKIDLQTGTFSAEDESL